MSTSSEVPTLIEDEETHFRPWSNLPLDLLKLISTKITDVVDYFNFRAVCSPWFSFSTPSKSPMIPLLLLPHDPHSDTLSFFHLPTSKVTTSHFPETLDKLILGSSFGWLALASFTNSSLSLFNPFTRSQIHLPPLVSSDYPRYRERTNAAGASTAPSFILQLGHPWKVSLSKNPSHDDNCIVVATLSSFSTFAICRLGTDSWLRLDWNVPKVNMLLSLYQFRSCNFDFKPSCFVVHPRMGLQGLARIPWPEDGCTRERCNVVMVGGKMHAVVYVRTSQIELHRKEEMLKVYIIQKWGEKFRWCEVTSIGEYVIFLSFTTSSAFRAAEIRGCKEDCIYFSSVYGSSPETRQPGIHYMDVFDLKENKYEQLSCPWESSMEKMHMRYDTWITPNLH